MYVIYNLHNNLLKKDTENKPVKTSKKSTSLATRKKVVPEFEWAREHKDEVDAEMRRRSAPASAIGVRREVVRDAFKGLEPPDRAVWKTRASAKRVQQTVQARLPVSEHKGFMKSFLHDIRQLTDNAHRAVGLSCTALFSYETKDVQNLSIFKIDSYTSPDIINYAISEEFGDSSARFGQWYRANKGVDVDGLAPAPEIVADVENHYRPKIPDEIGENPYSHRLRTLNRDFFRAEYQFHGGMGSVPYAALEKAYEVGELLEWLPNWPSNVPFRDFSRLDQHDNLEIFRFFLRRQQGLPAERCLWWAQVIVGSEPPNVVDASSVVTMKIGEREMYVMKYDGPVARPQSDRSITYTPKSWRYLHYDKHQRSLEHWCSLAGSTYDPTTPLIQTDTILFVQSVLEPVDHALSQTVTNMLRCVNEVERHGPNTTEDGLWGVTGALQLPDLLPRLKPASCPAAIDLYMREFWVKPSYAMSDFAAQRAGLQANSTLAHMFSWLESLDSSTFVHAPSKTLQGGDGGLVWVAVPLARLVMNTSVPALKASIHEDPPPDLDLQRLGYEHLKVVSCINGFLEKMTATKSILASSSMERVTVAEATLVHKDVEEANPPDPADSDDESTAESDEPVLEPEASIPSKKGKGKAHTSRPVQTKPKTRATIVKTSAKKSNPTNAKGKTRTKPAGKTFAALDQSEEGPVVVSSRESTPAAPSVPIFDLAWFEARVRPVDIDFAQRANIFGRFSAQPTVPTHEGSPQDLYIDFQRSHQDIECALAAWDQFDKSFCPHPDKALQQADLLSRRDTRPHLRPIISGILSHRCHVHYARSLWPKVVGLLEPLVLATHKLTALDQAIEIIVGDGATGPIRSKLKTSRKTIAGDIIKGRAIIETLIHRERLSTQWANQLRDCWDGDLASFGVAEVMRIAHELQNWRNETTELTRNLHNIHLSFRTTHEVESRIAPVNYLVGCPFGILFDGPANELLLAHRDPPYPDYLDERDQLITSGAAAPDSSSTAVAPPT
ncbi:hypothetical protein FRC07_003012, partial [Ceratobasidium sp. 392]